MKFYLIIPFFMCCLFGGKTEARTLRVGTYQGSTASRYHVSQKCLLEIKKVDLSGWEGTRYIFELQLLPPTSSPDTETRGARITAIPAEIVETLFAPPTLKPETSDKSRQEWQGDGGYFTSETGWNRMARQTSIIWKQMVVGSSPRVSRTTLRLQYQNSDQEFVDIQTLSYLQDLEELYPNNTRLPEPVTDAVICFNFRFVGAE